MSIPNDEMEEQVLGFFPAGTGPPLRLSSDLITKKAMTKPRRYIRPYHLSSKRPNTEQDRIDNGIRQRGQSHSFTSADLPAGGFSLSETTRARRSSAKSKSLLGGFALFRARNS